MQKHSPHIVTVTFVSMATRMGVIVQVWTMVVCVVLLKMSVMAKLIIRCERRLDTID